ncbi:hypothetical protein ERJ70_08040 [Sediminibacillus dalangtanensis]|uniref:Uncharacterized protein n=1 Tax=Sediminibacillus dalangtanensis TaxID=2729421 RepID=A0ABX7VRG8_9BACI|nr:hypothetical protein [Sediminibacillus dalangtanensis]QTM99256.1 hypothetical protein ERJ70_08040 [Sediminibacillus dalangtanensis]
MLELQDFLYELNKYMDQSSILKDAYNRLSDTEKQLVLSQSPTQTPPDELAENATKWLSAMQKEMGVTGDE